MPTLREHMHVLCELHPGYKDTCHCCCSKKKQQSIATTATGIEGKHINDQCLRLPKFYLL